MNWTELLKTEMEQAYKSTNSLLDLVDEDKLNWKPDTGNNWMTTGQLLKHISEGCGKGVKGFVTGDWGFPEGVHPSEMSPENMLPPAERMPTVKSVAEAKKLLAEDRQMAFDMLKRCSEKKLADDDAPAPWDPAPLNLGYRLLQMAAHLNSHKMQLFCHLKLQGKPVHTGILWGM